MPNKDISRLLFQPRKRYASVRMQQGRVTLDSDWNESESIDDEDARRTLLDVLCSKGTSNQGFLVGKVDFPKQVTPPGGNAVRTYDFEWQKGNFYLGGLRFETDAAAETFLGQKDWLQIDAAADNLPVLPGNLPPPGVRQDLVYLRGWEQCVTAVEDSELREQALGGPDTSVRIRRMRRVEVLTGVPDTCAAAFNALIQKLTAPLAPDTGPPHEFDPRNAELKSKARLTVLPDPGGVTEDPCMPAVPGGYLGADNQTICVQLTATDRFIWGYDNAAPLYRVQVQDIPNVPAGVDGTRRKIKFLTPPRDQAAQPLAGQAVEILPWGALLPNKEKVAEFQGQLFTVETSFDPEDGSLTITRPVPQELVEWLAGHAQFWSDRDEPDHRQYFYLRLWTGGSGDAGAPDHPFTPGTPVPLEGVGLSVSFSADGLPGDFWVIAARPHTPNLVVPWELLDAAPPAGPRYFFAPLALIRWELDQNKTLQARVHDCRERFRPLCELRGCCTVIVGDGVSGHGDFDAVEDAIAHLPAEGGEVCLLPGRHQANATITNGRNITIKGCGRQTRVTPRESNRESPIFRVVDGQGITLRDMELVTLGGTAIVLEGSEAGGALQGIDIVHNRILAFRQAIQVLRGSEIHVHDNHIRLLDKQGAGVAIQVLAEDGVIEHNDIGVVPADRTPPPLPPGGTIDPTDPCADLELVYANPAVLTLLIDHLFGLPGAAVGVAPFRAVGGIQVGAGSERVKIVDNTIRGGAGNGITLGGALAEPVEGPVRPQLTLEITGDRIQGNVLGDGKGLPDIGLAFTRANGVTRTALSAGGGFFSVRTEPGPYAVSLLSPGFKIESIAATDDAEFGRFQRVAVVREERPAPEVVLAFLYEIQIDRNEISGMGLSGIGFPIVTTPIPNAPAPPLTVLPVQNPAVAALLANIGNPVINLGIHRNHIHDCLQAPLEGPSHDEAGRRGFGGISLGYCDNVTVSENRIEHNGTSHVTPACGLFLRLGAEVDVHHNRILDNGLLAPDISRGLDPGLQGGILLMASSSGIGEVILGREAGFDTGRHAAHIHDNIVYQPAGHALRLLALGPTSICDNRFVSDLSGPESVERLAGVVFVLAGGDASKFPAGPTLFNSNQARLGEGATSLTSQLIWSTDDIGFDGNQCVAMTDGITLTDKMSMFANTFLLARTLRATDSRFTEPAGRRPQAFKFSLLTRAGLLNNTNNNHGDHCILAAAPHLNDIGNQVIDATLCSRLNASVAVPLSRFSVRTALEGD
jgi:hypothetical protein